MRGRTILITGAGSGFGEGAAIGMAQAGHEVIATVQISVNGGSWQSYGGSKQSHSINGQKGNTYGLRVRTIANRRSGDAGSPNWWTSPITGPAKATIPEPTPSVVGVSKGPSRQADNGTGDCAVRPCPTVKFGVRDFPGNTSWTLTVLTNGGSGSYTSSQKVRINSSGDGYSWSGYVVVDNGNGPVAVRLCRNGTCRQSAWTSW